MHTEAILTVAFHQTAQNWATQMQYNNQAFKTAGRNRGTLMRRDALITVAIVSALRSVPRKRYEQLMERAQNVGAEVPRVLVRVHSQYVDSFNAGLKTLHIDPRMLKMLRTSLKHWEIVWEPIKDGIKDGTVVALAKFAERVLLTHYHEEPAFDPHLPDIYRPDAVSMMERQPLPALTPDIIAAEETAR